tara:strand:+ start:1365 stop:1766 length:402 start_codon:yes stop_codon:yes gene_type:complete
MTTATETKAIEVGDILLCSWGYEANISDFYRVTKRTAATVTVEKLKSITVGAGDFYDARRVIPSDEVATERNWTKDGEIWEPIILKRKVKSSTASGWNPIEGDYAITREYIQPRNYNYAHIWSGDEQIDYNHH